MKEKGLIKKKRNFHGKIKNNIFFKNHITIILKHLLLYIFLRNAFYNYKDQISKNMYISLRGGGEMWISLRGRGLR